MIRLDSDAGGGSGYRVRRGRIVAMDARFSSPKRLIPYTPVSRAPNRLRKR